MTSNKLKIIACVSMVCDHVGFLLFPDLLILRYIGRLALPIFAYFIAEGCRHTRSKTKYFLQVLGLALVCQLFYTGESLIRGSLSSVYLNVLFTFSLSIVLCAAYLRFADTLKSQDRKRLGPDIGLLAAAVLLCLFCCYGLSPLCGIPVTVDYGIMGILLPLWALVFTDRKKQLLSFSVGTLLYSITRSLTLQSYTWYALLALPLLALYNGRRGSRRLKWAFYLFYPLHLGLIYALTLFL